MNLLEVEKEARYLIDQLAGKLLFEELCLSRDDTESAAERYMSVLYIYRMDYNEAKPRPLPY